MIQILGIRFNPATKRKTDAFFREKWRAPSVQALLLNPDKYLSLVPLKERYNLYYTVALCTDDKRKLLKQDVMPFDIDPPRGQFIDEKNFTAYISVVVSVLGVEANKIGTVFSGGGLQFLVGLKIPFENESFFEQYRDHYKAIIHKINLELKRLGLNPHAGEGSEHGGADPSVFSPARLFRMPNTENRKEGRAITRAYVIQPNIEPQDFSLSEISGIPLIKRSDSITNYGGENDRASKFPEPDAAAILKGCEFLKYCKENANNVSEAQWYAALSITARLPNGNQISHDLSQGHSKYTHSETEHKIDQSLKASGPRTCSNIDSLWNGCKGCQFNEKVSSPILIQGEEFIKTKTSGFHNVHVNAKGEIIPKNPNYGDLLKFFDQKYKHIVLDSSGIVYVWSKTHYKKFEDLRIKAFAQDHFIPMSSNKMRSEFKEVVTTTHIKPSEFFTETISGRMNFQNGIYDRSTNTLSPHSPDIGFRYCLPYNFDPEAKSPLFEKFLSEITGQDGKLQSILLEFMGYAFSNDDCWLAKALILTGEGSNGKSTFLNVMKELAGKDNYSALNMGEIKSEVNRQLMDGKLFNLAEETPKNALADSANFKNLITGGEMQVKALYKQPYSITNKTKLIFATNQLPQTDDTSKAFFRRLCIVPFNQVFEKEKRDPHLIGKLKAELPGIFNLVMRGYSRVLEQKALTESPVSDKEIENYKEELCTVTRWFKESVSVKPFMRKKWTDRMKLFTDYTVKTEGNKDKCDNNALWGKKLKKLIKDYDKRVGREIVGDKREYVLYEVSLGISDVPF